jgi:hypothetical protein
MIETELSRCVASFYPGATGVTGAAKLSGGASQETWRFDIVHPGGNVGAILRRAPPGYGESPSPSRAPGLENEALLMQLAHDAGVPSPRVLHVLKPEEGLGRGFIMIRVEGETIARKILRDAEFAKARPLLARQLGKIAAGIHGLPEAKLPKLRTNSTTIEIAELTREYRSTDWPRPVFELALRWLADPRGDAGAWRFSPRQSHHRSRRRARRAGLGDRASRRPHGGLGVDLHQLLALWRDRQAGRRFWLARGSVCGLRRSRPQGLPRARDFLGSHGLAALGHHVRPHDAAIPQRPRSLDGAGDDRAALFGDGD